MYKRQGTGSAAFGAASSGPGSASTGARGPGAFGALGIPNSSGLSSPPTNPGTAVPGPVAPDMPEGPRPPSPKGPGSIRHHSGSPPDGAWSRPAMCGADAEGQSVTGSPAPRSSGTGRAASGPGPADPGGEGSSALCDAPLRDASFRSIPRRARGTPRGSAAPAAASARGDGSGTAPSPDSAAAETSSPGAPSLPRMRRTTAGESEPSVPRCRSISPRSVATSLIRAPEDSCCCCARSPTRLR